MLTSLGALGTNFLCVKVNRNVSYKSNLDQHIVSQTMVETLISKWDLQAHNLTATIDRFLTKCSFHANTDRALQTSTWSIATSLMSSLQPIKLKLAPKFRSRAFVDLETSLWSGRRALKEINCMLILYSIFIKRIIFLLLPSNLIK